MIRLRSIRHKLMSMVLLGTLVALVALLAIALDHIARQSTPGAAA